MATAESKNLTQRTPEPGFAHATSVPTPGASLWWLVWIPVIVVVVLWIGGWWLGNYGGPWESKPRYIEPQISQPANAMLHFNARPSGDASYEVSLRA